MTSKILFSKLLKENMRRRLGVSIITLFYFLCTILLFVIQIQNAMVNEGPDKSMVYKAILDCTLPNGIILTFIILLGVLTAICSFAYLHSKAKTDFYHSLPVRRKQLFWVITVNSFLIFGSMLAASLLIRALIAAALGYCTPALLGDMLLSAGVYLLGFAAAYFTAALAMIMTGNIVVGVMGTAVFAAWTPIIIKWMIAILGDTFFTSFVEPTQFLGYFDYGSPVYLAYRLTEAGGTNVTLRALAASAAVLCLWIAVLAVLCQILFEKRPSDAAGKAMAFPKVNPVIRVLLVIPAAIYTGFYLYSMAIGTSKIWMFIGICIGGVFFHGLIECIFHFDIRAAFNRRGQMAATLAVAIAIAVSCYFDIYGYDSYVPKADKVESVMIDAGDVQNQMGVNRAEDSGTAFGKGVTGETKEETLALLKDAVRHPVSENEEDGTYLQTVYYLKNGKTARRNFYVQKEKSDEILKLLFQTEEYKENSYALYSKKWDDITEITWSNGIESQILNLTQEEKNQFFTVYLEEFNAFTYEDIKNTIPIGEFMIERSPDNPYNLFEEYYFIYPSFTKTLAFLKNKGCRADKTLADTDITKIEIYDYNGGEEEEWTVTDPSVIEQVKKNLHIEVFVHWVQDAGYNIGESGCDIRVYYRDGRGEGQVSALTDQSTLKQMEK